MILVLLLGVVIAGLAAALAVRGLAAGRFRHRQLVAQVGLYGFDAPSATDAPGRPALEEALSRLATWIGQRVERRFDEERRAKIRLALNSAGFYRTSVARYLG